MATLKEFTVFSASSGNAEATEALERAVEIYYHPGEEPPVGLPGSEPVRVPRATAPRGGTVLVPFRGRWEKIGAC